MRLYLNIAVLSASVNLFLSYICRMFPNLFLVTMGIRVLITLILLSLKKNEVMENLNTNALVLGMGFGGFLGYWDEISWILPLYINQISVFATLTTGIICVVVAGYLLWRNQNNEI